MIVFRTRLAQALRAVTAVKLPRGHELTGLVRVAATASGLELCGTDLTTTVIARAPALEPSADRWTCVVRSYELSQVIRAEEEDSVAVTLFEQGLTIGYRTIPTSLSDWPVPPETPPSSVTLPLHSFSELLRQVEFAAARSITRAKLRHVFLSYENDVLVARAADGKRLARSTLACRALRTVTLPSSLAVPVEAVDALLTSCRGWEGDVALRWSNDGDVAALHHPGAMIHFRASRATLPDYESCLPEDFAVTVEVDAVELRREVERVNRSYRRGDTRGVSLTLESDKQPGLVVAASAQRATCPCTIIAADSARRAVRFTAQTLIEALRAAPRGALKLGFSGDAASVLRHGNWRCALMPILLNEKE